MNRHDILQLAIIITALMVGFLAMEYVPQLLGGIFGWVANGMNGSVFFDQLISICVLFTSYILIAIILVRKSKSISEYLVNKTDLNPHIQLEQNKIDLLFILFIGIGVYGMAQNFPYLLRSLLQEFTTVVSKRGLNEATYIKKPDYVLLILKIFIPLIIVIFSKPLAEYFGNMINNKEPLDEIGSEE